MLRVIGNIFAIQDDQRMDTLEVVDQNGTVVHEQAMTDFPFRAGGAYTLFFNQPDQHSGRGPRLHRLIEELTF